MIAKNLRAGKYADGIINYIFKGREDGHIDKQAHVLKASDTLLLPFSAQDADGLMELKQDFNQRTNAYLNENKENKNPLIGHQILSFTPEDEKKLGKDGVNKILDEYVEMSGLKNTIYVAVGHRDTNNYHVHIVYHKVGNDMKKENDWRQNNKTIERGVALALRHNLTLIKDQAKVAMTRPVLQLRKDDPEIKQMRNESPYLSTARNMHHLMKLLEADNKKLQEFNNGLFRFDNKTYRVEDLHVIFFANREKVSKKSFEKQKESERSLLPKTTKSVNLDNERSVSRTSSPSRSRQSILHFQSIHSDENKPLRRKRKGYQYKLKKRRSKSIDKGLKL